MNEEKSKMLIIPWLISAGLLIFVRSERADAHMGARALHRLLSAIGVCVCEVGGFRKPSDSHSGISVGIRFRFNIVSIQFSYEMIRRLSQAVRLKSKSTMTWAI